MSNPPSDRPVPWADSEPGPDWHSDTRAIFKYWRSIHPANGLPGRRHVDPPSIKRLLPGVWLMDVQREPFRVRYRLIGTRVTTAIGRDVTGQWLDEAHPDLAEIPRYFDRYKAVVETAIPSWRRGRPQLWIHEDYGLIENLFMPLAEDGTTVDMLLAFTTMLDLGKSDAPSL